MDNSTTNGVAVRELEPASVGVVLSPLAKVQPAPSISLWTRLFFAARRLFTPRLRNMSAGEWILFNEIEDLKGEISRLRKIIDDKDRELMSRHFDLETEKGRNKSLQMEMEMLTAVYERNLHRYLAETAGLASQISLIQHGKTQGG